MSEIPDLPLLEAAIEGLVIRSRRTRIRVSIEYYSASVDTFVFPAA